ncbi:MAG: tetratricopeptide repeat protein [Phocaeicola sp.]
MGILERLFGEGRKDKTKQARIEEKNFDLLKYDGIRAQRLGKRTYAIKCWEEALVLKEEEETMGVLAAAYMQANRLEEAQNLFQRLIKLDSTKKEHFMSSADLYHLQEQYEAMDQMCQQALELDTKDPIIHFLAGKAAVGLKKEIDAIASLTKAIALKADYIAAIQLRAEVLWGMHQTKDAADDIQTILELEAENEEALLLKGEILFSSNHVDEAEEALIKLLQINPFNEKGYLHLGNLYLEIKSLDKALALYDEAIEINPEVATFYHERGRVKLVLGDKEGSVTDMKKSIEMSPEKSGCFDGTHNNYESGTQNVPW